MDKYYKALDILDSYTSIVPTQDDPLISRDEEVEKAIETLTELINKFYKCSSAMTRLFVRDNVSNYVHEVGTDVYDSLTLTNKGIVYYNLQNGCSSDFGTYSFCNQYGTDIEMAHKIYDEKRYLLIGNHNYIERVFFDNEKKLKKESQKAYGELLKEKDGE